MPCLDSGKSGPCPEPYTSEGPAYHKHKSMQIYCTQISPNMFLKDNP